MAYIPPHKRRSKDDDDNRLPPHKRHSKKSRALRVYMKCAVSDQWFIEADDDDDDQIPADSIRLEPFLGYKSAEWERGGKPFVLVCDSPRSSSSGSTQPWVSITESIWSDLLDSFANMGSAMVPHSHGYSLLKPTLVAKIGNILFHKPPDSAISSRSEAESALADVGKQFCTNLPDSHLEAIFAGAAPKIIADSHQTKEYYRVNVSDKWDPASVISIKCQIICGELKIQKIEKNQQRCFVADFSCLHKDLDLRLMLATKRDLSHLMNALKGDKLKGLRQLVDSAVLDGQVKGGLRWPLGKEHSSDGRYSVVGAWHSTVRTFKNSSLKLRFVNADRFDFCTSDGEIGKEMTLVLKGITDTFIDRVVYMESAMGRLLEALKFVWDHLLDFEQ
ncbi:hypothetical protein MKW94_006620 [Papaver nudicaule]|uniref:DUF7903 domain-containing protein n=1 Tax=Papaver nudicaule TaxID=74823 RepID=A0AA41W3B7_PAPNU|nr:hypothetical protein [Papaver nudicaule]